MDQPIILAQKIIEAAENTIARKEQKMDLLDFIKTLNKIAEGVQNGTLACQDDNGEPVFVSVH